MFFGAPNPLLIIHEICLAVSTYGHGTSGKTECNKLLKRLHEMIPDFLEKIKIQVGMYRKIQCNPQEE